MRRSPQGVQATGRVLWRDFPLNYGYHKPFPTRRLHRAVGCLAPHTAPWAVLVTAQLWCQLPQTHSVATLEA